MRAYFYAASTMAGAILPATEALASFTAVPGPVAAVGAPAMLIVGGAFLAVRYLRSRRK